MERLFVLAEGDDDKIFFDRIIRPRLEERYGYIQTWRYAGASQGKIPALIKSIKSMRADYLYLGDLDEVPCVTRKKQKIEEGIGCMDMRKVIVVVKEIESWYLAGIDVAKAGQLRIKVPANTERVTKEQFERLMPGGFSSRMSFMVEIAKSFSWASALRKNTSFRYFAERLRIAV